MIKQIFASFIGFTISISIIITILVLKKEYENLENRIDLALSTARLSEKKIDDHKMFDHAQQESPNIKPPKKKKVVDEIPMVKAPGYF